MCSVLGNSEKIIVIKMEEEGALHPLQTLRGILKVQLTPSGAHVKKWKRRYGWL